MSIAPLTHVTLVGHRPVRDAVLEALQSAGLMHVVPLTPGTEDGVAAVRAEAVSALRYLQAAPIRRRPTQKSDIDPDEVARRAASLQARERDLNDEKEYLEAKEKALQPWGDFELPPLGALGRGPRGPLRLWFYAVPSYRLDQLHPIELPWSIVASAPGVAYVVVVADEEPAGMPVERTQTGAASLSTVRRRLEAVLEAREGLQFERADLSRYREHLAAHLDELLDRAARSEVAARAWEDEALFALGGWIPTRRRSEIEALAADYDCAILQRAPTPEDAPPTLLENRGLARAGQSLLTFYTTPGYFEWDPSPIVLGSFAFFFALILSDAGYAAFMLAGWLAFAGPLRRSWGRPLWQLGLLTLSLSIGWGVLVGSYFGMAPAGGTPLAELRRLSLEDHATMMRVSIGIGVAHVIAANLLRAILLPRSGALGAIGWCIAIATGWALWRFGEVAPQVSAAAPWSFGVAGALILGFSSTSRRVGARLLDGARALMNVTAAFGDVLSYLRLFALGLASSSLAIAFNGLARDVASVEGIGVLLALVVLVVGHGINLALAIMGGFVHGLRLNFIEFLRWGTTTEGQPFRAFAQRRR